MKIAMAIAAAAFGAAAFFAGASVAKEEPADYVVLRENVSVLMDNSVSRNFGVGRDGSSIVFREGRSWYRATLLPPCAHNLGTETRIGLVHRGPWFDRGSQVLVGDHRCHVRRLDQIADPRAAREEKD